LRQTLAVIWTLDRPFHFIKLHWSIFLVTPFILDHRRYYHQPSKRTNHSYQILAVAGSACIEITGRAVLVITVPVRRRYQFNVSGLSATIKKFDPLFFKIRISPTALVLN
jgi:hypothetical protein